MLIPDYETKVDFLNCEAIAGTVATVLRSNRAHPLTVGIHGDWGAGKSSILKMIEVDLSEDESVAVLWFNGWTFEGFDDAKTVLIGATITELSRHPSLDGRAMELVTGLLRRVDWLKAAKRTSGLLFNVLTGLLSPDQVESALGMLKSMKDDASSDEGANFPDMVDEVIDLFKPNEIGESVPETIYTFREDFSELLDRANIEQLVVLIDDLDRCLPATAIETLEAIRLFLFVPKTAFVIGADEAMIEYAVQQHFPDLPLSSGPLPYARNYLEKLIQIPFRIPALGAQETRAYVTLLLVQSIVGEEHEGFKELLKKVKEGMKKPWAQEILSQADVRAVAEDKKEELDMVFILAQQIAPILAEGTKGNPRQVKRFLNALLIRQTIAEARGFGEEISQSVLAKLMLAERFQPDFYDNVALQVMASMNGQSKDLTSLESPNEEKPLKQAQKTKGKGGAALEKEVTKWHEREWLQRWRTIKPSIGEIDLRPYIFAAKDKSILADKVVTDPLESLIGRLMGSRLAVQTTEQEVRNLAHNDARMIFNSLRERVLTVSNFEEMPSGIDGLAMVAKHHTGLQNELIDLIRSFNVKKLGTWAVKGWVTSITEPQVRASLKTIIEEWAQQSDNNKLKRAAERALPAMARVSN